ncbi:MAG: hypothetical protein NVSMB26_04660 [Beijerinckiaceae bacterium]
MTPPRNIAIVVDDEQLVRQDALDLLTLAGITARGFGGACETLAYLCDHAGETAVVFTDVWMESEFEGIELARAIHRRWPWIALLVTSGGTARPPAALPLKAHYISKPWRPEQVLRFVRKSLERAHTAADPV